MTTNRSTTLFRIAAVLFPLLAASPALSLAADMATPVPGTAATPDKPLDTLTFTQVNASGNGKITPDEFKAAGLSESLFSTIDTNHDGVITKDEFDTYGPVTRAKN